MNDSKKPKKPTKADILLARMRDRKNITPIEQRLSEAELRARHPALGV